MIHNEQGQPVWDLSRFSFITEGAPAPEAVNPSLWRQSQLVYLGVRLNGSRAVGKKITLNPDFPDTKETYVLVLQNGALNHRAGTQLPDADATITMSRAALNKIILRESSLDKEIGSGDVQILGKKDARAELVALLDEFEFRFNIVTP